MFYDFSVLWPWLVVTALVAIGVGLNSQTLDWRPSWRDSWLKRVGIVIVIAIVLALLPIFHGRFAFWLESAILFAIVYVLFGAIGHELKHGEIRRHFSGEAPPSH